MPDGLLERLAFAVDHLGHAVAQVAVVVDVGIGNVLEGQVLEPFERGIYVGLAGADALEQFGEFRFIHYYLDGVR